MVFNLPGTLVPFHLLFKPRLVLPAVSKDIRHLDFVALRKAGYRGAVFDKDNCLTSPHKDDLVPELRDAWHHCRSTFGQGNVVVVSNSAGTARDAGGIQAESVMHHLSVPVLRHRSMKPSYSCIGGIRAYFASLPKPIREDELIVVGDRVFTDIVMANRMHRRSSSTSASKPLPSSPSDAPQSITLRTGPLSVLTTGVWVKESMAMRRMEKAIVDAVRKWIVRDTRPETEEEREFVRRFVEVKEVKTRGVGWLRRLLSFGRA